MPSNNEEPALATGWVTMNTLAAKLLGGVVVTGLGVSIVFWTWIGNQVVGLGNKVERMQAQQEQLLRDNDRRLLQLEATTGSLRDRMYRIDPRYFERREGQQ